MPRSKNRKKSPGKTRLNYCVDASMYHSLNESMEVNVDPEFKPEIGSESTIDSKNEIETETGQKTESEIPIIFEIQIIQSKILSKLSIEDLKYLGLTCKKFYDIVKVHKPWLSAYIYGLSGAHVVYRICNFRPICEYFEEKASVTQMQSFITTIEEFIKVHGCECCNGKKDLGLHPLEFALNK